MQGVGDPEGGFFKRLSRHPSLVALPIAFRNEGIGGNTLSDMLERAPKTAHERPYDLIVLLGCNDLPRANDKTPERRSTLASYREKTASLLAMIRGERSLFITSFAVAEKQTGIEASRFMQYVDAAISIATAQGYECWDLYRESKAGIEALLSADGLHMNAAGHRMIAERLVPWIQGKPWL